MKFPLPRHPYPSVVLSPRDIQQLDSLTNALLDQAVAEFEDFVHVRNRHVDTNKWNHLKTRENMHVYRAVGDHSDDPHLNKLELLMDATTGSELPISRLSMKGNNRLLGVGSIVGTLPDLLYCASAHNEDEMQIRTSYSNDECVDWRVLHKLREGSPDNPFRMHAIKWYVKSSPGVTKLVVRPRDCVLLDCVGEMTLPSGERIGYFMYHSINIPGCEPMDGFVRGLISAMYLFRTKGPNTIEVFMRSVCEMGGNVNDSIAALSVANGLIAMWKMPWGGQNKKLAWLLKQQRLKGKKPAKPAKSSQCGLCKKGYSIIRTAAACELCRQQVCSSCVTVRKISHVRSTRELVQISTAFCKNCITQASMLNATEIAHQEFVEKELHSRISSSVSSSGSRDASQTPNSSGSWTSRTAPHGVDSSTVSIETEEDWERQYQVGYKVSSGESSLVSQPSPASMDPHKMHLVAQMSQLRLAAEQTYQITKENEQVMNRAQ
ncbi:hypothetical protein Poli38472_001971 [Pythium oligandrum]|uniref:FYVE-type domain-containing protein n=1 Tax=Pythium oligandrum TaxID=41045 RepID=A0A8K1CW69_PYTOL|nr:hypothetical protein Poli38472_001971 [Pythium oligandrum]|eukprot:TMW69815.1 hypothetical protein Poli38472_001971 [Pythium oligandrum]